MSFLGGFLTPPPKQTQPEQTTAASFPSSQAQSQPPMSLSEPHAQSRGRGGARSKEGAERSSTSLYSAFSGVKNIVSSYSSSSSSASVLKSKSSGESLPQSQRVKALDAALQRFRLQSPESHLGMLMAFNEKSLSPFFSDEFRFTWHRLRNGRLEDISSYNSLSRNSHSWYPPSADDLGCVLVLHCEDAMGLGLSRQLESTAVHADEAFAQRVETTVRQNKMVERVVISSYTDRLAPSRRSTMDSKSANGSLYRPDTMRPSQNAVEGREQIDSHISYDDEHGASINLSEFEVGGSISVNSEGLLLREKGTRDCGLHIDSTNFLSLTCLHPASFIIEVPMYYAGNDENSDSGSCNDLLAPISSVSDMSSVSTLRPSMEWLGEPDGDMYASLEDVVNPEDNPLEKSLEELVGMEEQDFRMLHSSVCLQVACRDRATRDMLVLAIRSLAGYVPEPYTPPSSSDDTTSDTIAATEESEGQDENSSSHCLQERLKLLPWYSARGSGSHRRVSSSPADLHTYVQGATTTTIDVSGAGCSSCSSMISSTVSDMKADVARKDEKIQQLESFIDQFQNEQRSESSSQGDITALRQQVAEADEKISQQVTQINEQEEKHMLALSELQAANEAVLSLKEEVVELHKERSASLSTQRDNDSKIEELVMLVKELQSAREELIVDLESSRRDVVSLQESVSEYKQHEAGEGKVVSSTLLVQYEEQTSQLLKAHRDIEALRCKHDSFVSSGACVSQADVPKSVDEDSTEDLEEEGQFDLELSRKNLVAIQDILHEMMRSYNGKQLMEQNVPPAGEELEEHLRDLEQALHKLLYDHLGGLSTSSSFQFPSLSVSLSGGATHCDTSDVVTTVSDGGDNEMLSLAFPIQKLHALMNEFNLEQSYSDIEGLKKEGDFLSLVDALRQYMDDLHQQISTHKHRLVTQTASHQVEYNAFLQKLQGEIQVLSDQMMGKDEAHQRICKSYVEQIDGLNESIRVLQSKTKQLNESKREVEERATSLQREVLSLSEAQAKNASDKSEEMENMSKECASWNEECVRLKDMLMSIQQASKPKEEAASKMKQDFDLLTVRLQEEKQRNQILTTQSAKERQKAEQSNEKVTYELSQAKNTVKVMEARIAGLQTETLTLSDERHHLKRQKSVYDSSKSQIAQLRSQLMESDQTAQATRALLDETTSSNERLRKENKDCSVELSSVNNLLAQKTARIEELKDRLQVMDNEIASCDKVKNSFRKENARLREAAKQSREDSDTVKTLTPLYKQQLSMIADAQSKVVDLESALSDVIAVRNQFAVIISSLEMKSGLLEDTLQRRQVHSEWEGMAGEDRLCISLVLLEKITRNKECISQLESSLSEAKAAEPFELKKLNFMVSKLSGEKNHYESKAKSLSKDLQRKLLAGTPLQRELGKITARLEEVENERNAYRDAMVLACETYSHKEVSSWFG